MSQALNSTRPFVPGTTGWSVDDLYDPDTQWLWSEGRHELVDGVLTTMAPQHLHGIRPLSRLRFLIELHLRDAKQPGDLHHEVDLVLKDRRVVRPDMVLLTREQDQAQREADRAAGRADAIFGPITVVPLLVVESLSPGHESHDRETKREWYAEFGIPNYWLLDATARSLECLVLESGKYVLDVAGSKADALRPRLFPGLPIPLGELWAE